MSEPTIRNARLQDVPLILRFIREAAHEQAPGYTIEATDETLTKTLHFAPSSTQDVLPGRFAWPLIISSPGGDAAGLLIYFFNYSTWSAAPGVCLEELYVVPEYRRHGYAQMLVEAMAGEAKKAGCAKMDWVCLQGNQRALKFYEKMGAKRMEDWTVLKVGREGIEELAARARPVSD